MKKASAIVDRIFGILFFMLTVGIVIISFVAVSDVFEHQTAVNTSNEDYYTYTEEDVHMLGDLMYAGTEGALEGVSEKNKERAMKLWGQVALNWKNLYSDKKLEDVIFSQIYNQETQDKIGNIDTPKKVYKWAEELLQDGSYAPGNLLHAFNAPDEDYEEYDHIGNIYFYLD